MNQIPQIPKIETKISTAAIDEEKAEDLYRIDSSFRSRRDNSEPLREIEPNLNEEIAKPVEITEKEIEKPKIDIKLVEKQEPKAEILSYSPPRANKIDQPAFSFRRALTNPDEVPIKASGKDFERLLEEQIRNEEIKDGNNKDKPKREFLKKGSKVTVSKLPSKEETTPVHVKKE